jgi:acetoin utilization deacetylase AcuC-like enzyme
LSPQSLSRSENSTIESSHIDYVPQISSLLPSNKNRSLFIHALVKSLGLLSPNLANRRQLELVKPHLASQEDLAQYHDREYLEFIFSNNIRQLSEESRGLVSEWGLEDVRYFNSAAGLKHIKQLRSIGLSYVPWSLEIRSRDSGSDSNRCTLCTAVEV